MELSSVITCDEITTKSHHKWVGLTRQPCKMVALTFQHKSHRVAPATIPPQYGRKSSKLYISFNNKAGGYKLLLRILVPPLAGDEDCPFNFIYPCTFKFCLVCNCDSSALKCRNVPFERRHQHQVPQDLQVVSMMM